VTSESNKTTITNSEKNPNALLLHGLAISILVERWSGVFDEENDFLTKTTIVTSRYPVRLIKRKIYYFEPRIMVIAHIVVLY
jgi:hypothetical protein